MVCVLSAHDPQILLRNRRRPFAAEWRCSQSIDLWPAPAPIGHGHSADTRYAGSLPSMGTACQRTPHAMYRKILVLAAGRRSACGIPERPQRAGSPAEVIGGHPACCAPQKHDLGVS